MSGQSTKGECIDQSPIESSIHQERELLSEILTVLQEAYPRKSSSIFSRMYDATMKFVKYFGIPGVILAAILPLYNAGSALVDYRNSQILRGIYEEYTIKLLEDGSVERATAVLDTLENGQLLDVRTQYLKGKLLAATAIRRGKEQDLAIDLINILSSIHSKSDFLFPALGGESELISLQLNLADISIQKQNYPKAKQQLKSILDTKSPEYYIAEVYLRLGTIAVLTYNHDEADEFLNSSIKMFKKLGDLGNLAEAQFQQGKNYQFSFRHSLARELYRNAIINWEKRNDEWALVKAYNNLAMIENLEGNTDEAVRLYETEVFIARKIGDDLGLARGLVNLTGIKRRLGDIDTAKKYLLEATILFQKQDNKLGLATGWGQLARIHAEQEQFGEVIHYGQKALYTFIDIKEYTQAALSLQILANAYFNLELYEDAVFFHLVYLTYTQVKGGKELSSLRGSMRISNQSIEQIKNEIDIKTFSLFVESAKLRYEHLKGKLGLSSNTRLQVPEV